jgi:selenoprotein W-related protein
LADEIKKELNLRSKLVASGGGVFEITVDGKLIFSKRSLDRFPDDGEVVELIRSECS